VSGLTRRIGFEGAGFGNVGSESGYSHCEDASWVWGVLFLTEVKGSMREVTVKSGILASQATNHRDLRKLRVR
jgi:hypothetical protein